MGAGAGDLPVSTDKVIAFCRELLESKTPAWQRLQAVQAIEAYRDSVLNTEEPCLNDITATLKHLAAKEDALGQDTVVTAADEKRNSLDGFESVPFPHLCSERVS